MVVDLSYMNNLEDRDVANEATGKNKWLQCINSCRTASLIATLVKLW